MPLTNSSGHHIKAGNDLIVIIAIVVQQLKGL
jgi:hypothetical protein